ncbi:MAG: hypothetical protein RIQ89_2320 [Bacteroidota bacterium]|jgi:ribosome-associated protein
MMVKIEIATEFIQLSQLLKLLNWVENGSMAHQVVDEGLVAVNGMKATERRKKIRPGDVVSFDNQMVRIEKQAV